MANCGIYRIINLSNGRVYIGSTNNFVKRKNEHLSRLRLNRHGNTFLQNDFNKCGGFESFVFEMICSVLVEKDLLIVEQIFLDEYYDGMINCYNMAKIAGAPNRGRKFSEEVKMKMSEAHKGEKNHFFGKTHSKETRLKLSIGQKGEKHHNWGKKFSDEYKAKLSSAQQTAQDYAKKTFSVIGPNGEIVHGFGISGFVKQHGLDDATFRRMLVGKQRQHKGWRLNPEKNNTTQ
jgi:group I intron endonuclease